jgi:hypothetical protein
MCECFILVGGCKLLLAGSLCFLMKIVSFGSFQHLTKLTQFFRYTYFRHMKMDQGIFILKNLIKSILKQDGCHKCDSYQFSHPVFRIQISILYPWSSHQQREGAPTNNTMEQPTT